VTSRVYWFTVAVGCALVCAAGYFFLPLDGMSERHDFALAHDLNLLYDARPNVAGRRREIRRRIAREVISEQLTLLQAAEQFRDLNECTPGFCWDAFRSGYDGRNDDERHCLQVIQFVRQELQEGTEKERMTVRRLKGELAASMHDGEVKLPH
jgi:hypothetical protein